MKTQHALAGMRALGDFQPLWDHMETMHDGVSALARHDLASLYQAKAPDFELVDEDEAYWLYAETLDIREDDIAITVDDSGMLIVQGEQAAEACGSACDSILRPYRSFTRRFMLTQPVRKAAISTMCADGKLAVCIPKVAARQVEQPAMALL